MDQSNVDMSSLAQSPRHAEQGAGNNNQQATALKSPGRPKRRFPLGLKLLLGAALISLLPLALLAVANTLVASQRSRAALTQSAQNQLTSIRDTLHNQLSGYLETSLDNSAFIASTPTVIAAIKELVAGYNNLPLDGNNGQPLSSQDLAMRREALSTFYDGYFLEKFRAQNGNQTIDTQALVNALSDASVALQYAYIANNSFPEEERGELLDAKDGSSYSLAHAKYQQELKNLATALGFADIHLAEPENGTLVFTTEKQVDIGQSLANGPLANTPMGEAYAKVVSSGLERTAQIGNLTPFYPTYNELAFFTAIPVYEGDTLLGIVTLEVPSDTLDRVISDNQNWQALGLGASGETRIVDLTTNTRLTNDRELVENQAGFLAGLSSDGLAQNVIDTIASRGSSAGFIKNDQAETDIYKSKESDTLIAPDGDLASFKQLNVGGLSWALVADKDSGEVFGPVTALTNNLIRQSVLIALGLIALATLLTLFFVRSITRPVAQLASVAERVGQGDLSQQANVRSNDEIGELATSFNNAIVQLREANARQAEEIERGKQLQANIGEFLNVAMDIAQGDLTKRGQVSEDALGNVVDAINFMTEELGYVLKDVQNATESVNQGASDMFGTADTIARSAEMQAVEAQKAREDVQGIRSTMRQVSEEMNLSAESANQALTASREGRQAVVKTLEGMQDIRREVQAISKRVKSLGDRSLEISEIVETISRISEQTNLLAVNAAIESSGAGQAGLRFAVVAEQVRRLAEESAYAAERVSTLIKTVQDEVQEVITGVETGTREVEEGYRVASQAGQRLEDISTIVERSAALAQRISQTTQEQVGRVEQVGQVVEQMAEISVQSQVTVSRGREAAERLQQLAGQLSDNLSRFRLA